MMVQSKIHDSKGRLDTRELDTRAAPTAAPASRTHADQNDRLLVTSSILALSTAERQQRKQALLKELQAPFVIAEAVERPRHEGVRLAHEIENQTAAGVPAELRIRDLQAETESLSAKLRDAQIALELKSGEVYHQQRIHAEELTQLRDEGGKAQALLTWAQQDAE